MARGYRFGVIGSISVVPNGSTVLPTDDIQIWLKCASIKDKAYTTLVQVLADSTTLQTLISNNNAVDYLVRSTSWIASICADEDAMKTIGANDYATDSLLDDNTWRTAICNSSYYTAVLNVKVPTMTSNTTPSGEAFASVATSSGHDAYMAFDDNTSTTAILGSQQTTGGYGYDFGFAVGICKVSANMSYSGYNAKIQNSDDKTNWNDISAETTGTITGVNSFISNTYSKRRYNRILFTNPSPGSTFTTKEIQFYGRVNGGVQDWLRAGGITNKNYVTLAEVIADSTTLATLISNHNAMDYLVTAKGLIDIVNDSTAMSYIGANNYASDTLLADETWLNAICNSTYFESVLNVKVPTMTSNTTPSGIVINNLTTEAANSYKAFDGNNTTYVGADVTSNSYVGYDFTNEILLCYFSLLPRNDGAYTRIKNFKVQGSNDNDTWVDLYTGIYTQESSPLTALSDVIDTNNKYRYLRVYVIDTYSNKNVSFCEIQFYGRVDV